MGVIAVDVLIKKTQRTMVAYLGTRGPYAQIPRAMGKLYGWVTSQGMTPTGMPSTVYYTVPPDVPLEEAVWEIWSPVAPGASETPPDSEGLGVKSVEAATVASTIHTGPYEAIGAVYEALMAWIPEHGYEIVGAPRELYFSPPETPPEETVTEVQIPIRET